MLRLITYATQQQRQEMSFIRRLLDYSRYILRNHQILLGGRKRVDILPDNAGVLRIEGRGKVPSNIFGGNANNNAPLAAPGNSNASSTLQRIGQQIHSNIRQIFINNVLRRATANQEVARKAAQRLLYGDSRPFFALVGVSLATGSVGIVSQDSEFDGICWEIRESILRQNKEKELNGNNSEEINISSVSDLKIGPMLNQGCNAAVYAAKHVNSSSDEPNYDLAVKMMFNYDIESNAFAILKGMVKEIVPARHVDLKNLMELDQSLFSNVKRCPAHQNIIEINSAFVDQVPLLPQGLQNYPSALPRRLNPNDDFPGLGRNMSLFLVMKRYDASLQEYLRENPDIENRTRLLILTQVLSGVAHLEGNQIAHRDLKTDNILVDLSEGVAFPSVVISDFGCCLADKTHGLSLPFRTFDTDRGGNPALTAPEISTAVPGTWKYLNYKKSDVWTVGAISYEIFGTPNPFYGVRNSEKSTRLDSRTYSEDQLPTLERNLNPALHKLIRVLLCRNPDQRMSAEKAFNICILLLWGPSDWMTRSSGRYPNDDEILQWLVCLTAKALCHTTVTDQLEFKIIRSFLRNVKFSSLKAAVMWMVQCKEV